MEGLYVIILFSLQIAVTLSSNIDNYNIDACCDGTGERWPNCLENQMSGRYYIAPENQNLSLCPGEPCLTMSQMIITYFTSCEVPNYPNATTYMGASNGSVTLIFLPGRHFIPTYLFFYGDFVHSINITSLDDVTIDCGLQNPLIFLFYNNLQISNIDLWQCDVVIASIPLLNAQVDVDHMNLYGSRLSLSYTASRISNMVATQSIYENSNIISANSNTKLSNVSFICNGLIDSTSTYSDGPGVIYSKNGGLHVSDCNFTNNSVQAIVLYEATLELSGNVLFTNNSGYQGGAINMFDSYVKISNNSRVVFQSNSAYHVGGAIYSPGNAISKFLTKGIVQENCTISLNENSNSTIKFINNTAVNGGSAIYGITLSQQVCEVSDQFRQDIESAPVYTLPHTMKIIPDDLSAVSSDPLRVCICPDQSTPDCLAILPDQNIPHLHYTVYPGQNFTIPAAVVGFNFALTSGSVKAQFHNSDASLGSESQYVQGVSHTGCSQLQYSVLSDKKKETIVLTSYCNKRRVQGISNDIQRKIDIQMYHQILTGAYGPLLRNPDKYYSNGTFNTSLLDNVFRLAGYVVSTLETVPVFVSLTLLDCPLGFVLSGNPRCDCDPILQKRNITCNINNQAVHRHDTTWVNGSSKGVIVHLHCPFEYCKYQETDVVLSNPDTQCAFNRSGTLCGACKPGLSLALGSSQCLSNCSNKYVSLLLPFVLAGFVLVFFIKILNLTVSQGTVNGLIFYANIVAANHSIFFPAQQSTVTSTLHVFISWLNLDLGIETCFIKGLDGYWKTWLQFVFPFYIWAIAVAIIIVSRYSTRATKLFGNNSLSVLATLIILSYAKLLRTIITIFSFTFLNYPDNSTTVLWAFDANIPYLSPKHIPLFIFAFVIVLLLWLPYTAVLLSAQWLRTQTHRKRLRWLKPFLDAYYGPFEDKHHYWVGVLLVVRGVLFIFFASFFAIENNVNLLLISISSVCLTTYTSITGRLYKNIYLTVLENSFFLNLGVLAAGTLYIRLVGGNQEALVTTSVGIAFLQFIGITVFSGYCFIIMPAQKTIIRKRARKRASSHASEIASILSNRGSLISSRGDSVDDDSDIVDSYEIDTKDVSVTDIDVSELEAERIANAAKNYHDNITIEDDVGSRMPFETGAAHVLQDHADCQSGESHESRTIDLSETRRTVSTSLSQSCELQAVRSAQRGDESPKYYAAKGVHYDYTEFRESMLADDSDWS